MSMEQVSQRGLHGYFQEHSPWKIEAFAARCHELWDKGESAAMIANQLNREFRGIAFRQVSRNAVLGHADRHNFSTRRTSRSMKTDRPKQPKQPRIRKRLHISKKNGTAPGWYDEISTDVGIEDQNIPLVQRKTVLQLTDATCKWPVGEVGEPGFFFCGGDSIEGSSYCAHHSRRAFQPYTPRVKSHFYSPALDKRGA